MKTKYIFKYLPQSLTTIKIDTKNNNWNIAKLKKIFNSFLLILEKNIKHDNGKKNNNIASE